MLAVAHRGGNDLDELRRACDAGADVIEADVHLHQGRLEVRHHKSLGPLPWYWDKWELQPAARFPLRLDHLLDALPPGTTLMLDLKGVGRAGSRVARALHERAPGTPLMVCARWWPSVLPFRDVPWARTLLSARGDLELRRLRRRLRTGSAPDGVSLHLSLLTPAVVAEVHEQVPLILTWPVDDRTSLAAAARVGVDGVITKSLDVVADVRAARAPG